MSNDACQIEVFSEEGCPACSEILQLVLAVAPTECNIKQYDIDDNEGSARAKELKIYSAPSVVIDGKVLRIL